jgi:glycoside/pentoside/hexuronide:cation symporter, GPH family
VTSTPAAPAHQGRLSLPALLTFSMPGLTIGALAVALGVYLPPFYAGHLGVGLKAVGFGFMAVRLADMLVDPVLGLFMDRTHTRFGRYRVWLMLGAPVLTAAVFMLFLPPAGIGYMYLIGWLFIYYIGTSLITLSHASWASVIAANYHERSRVFGVIQVISIIGATVVLIVPTLLHSHTAGGDVHSMGWFIVLLTPIGVILATTVTRERITKEVKSEHFGLRDYWEMISRPDMRRIIFADFCLALGPGWMAAIYLFYFHDARGFSAAESRYLLAIYIIAGVLGAAVLSWVATRLGKHRTLMFAATGYSLGLIGLTFLPKSVFGPAAVFMFMVGFLAAAFPLLDRAMVADVGDAVLLEQGKNRVGLLYAMITSVQKIASALSIGLTFEVLDAIGFNAKEGAHNTPAAIHGLELVYLIGPVFFVMLGGACFIGYKLDHKRHAEIRKALDERDALTAESPVLEGLTGPAAQPIPEPG